MKDKIFILAGEPSGDMHGAALISELKNKNPELKIFGVGGEKMIDAGLIPIYNINDFAFLGFTEIVKHLPKIFSLRKNILDFIIKENIRTVLLIDYPGFNLNIAKKLKRLNVKVLYYISPQLWAWGSSRAKKLKERIDRLFVIFPFEVMFFKQFGIDAEFVGHPLIERISDYKFLEKEIFFRKFNLNTEKELLLLMPGSRKHEVELILPPIFNAAKKLEKLFDLQVVISASSNIPIDYYKKFSSYSANIIQGKTYELLKYSKFGIIKSGTSTLEASLFGLPFVVVYKTGKLTYLIGKLLVKIPSIALPNIVYGEKITEELIQDDVNEKTIFEVVRNILIDNERLKTISSKLLKIKEKLSSEAVEKKLSERILEELE